MRSPRWLALSLCLLALPAVAADWTLSRFEGRDYVTLNDVARFYGLPQPEPVVLTPTEAAAAPAPIASPVKAASESEGDPIPSNLELTGGRLIKLTGTKSELAFVPNSRESEINGVKQWLAFAARVEEQKIMISRLDLTKVIEPRLRPEKIPGLKPVTTVVLDPGHGGHDKGAPSRFGYEKDFALDVALNARTLLEKQGFKVVMTRSTDTFIPLPQRAAVANAISDAIFVSIHFNSTSSNDSARGFEIYSMAPRGAPATNDGAFSLRDLRDEPGNIADTQSTALAGTVFDSLLGNVPLPDRGIKHARFAVLRLCTKPAILIECGFVSNGPESALIGTPAWRAKVAEAIVTGVGSYKDLAENGQKPKFMVDYRRASGTQIP